MKKKPASLEALMAGDAAEADELRTVSVPGAQPAAVPAKSDRTVEKLTVYVPRAAAKRLKQMALDNDMRVNDYLREAVDLMLAKHGQPSIREFENGRR